jgi:hypothetical protein
MQGNKQGAREGRRGAVASERASLQANKGTGGGKQKWKSTSTGKGGMPATGVRWTRFGRDESMRGWSESRGLGEER